MNLTLYYDLTCEYCHRTRSRDFNHGISSNQAEMLQNAQNEGWISVSNFENLCSCNMCPICARIREDDRWKSVEEIKPPVDETKMGIESKTDKTYKVLTQEGWCVDGYIYKNTYSCSGYAVFLGNDSYLNNVTHWIPSESAGSDEK